MSDFIAQDHSPTFPPVSFPDTPTASASPLDTEAAAPGLPPLAEPEVDVPPFDYYDTDEEFEFSEANFFDDDGEEVGAEPAKAVPPMEWVN